MGEWTQAGPGIMINLGEPRDGVLLDQPTIDANGKTFSLLEASVMDDDHEVSFDRLNQVLGEVASIGGLHGEPKTLVAITEGGNPVYAQINYWRDTDFNHGLRNLRDYPRVAKISNFGSGSNWPDLDVFLTNLTISHDPGTVAPILVVDPSVKLKPYGKNKIDDSVKRVNNNPYKGLEKFVGKEYDGSLGIPELDKFKGFKFGNGQWSYVYGVTHRGRNLSVTGFMAKLPKIGDKYEVYDSEWEIQAIEHEKFDDEFTGADPKYARKQFDQHLMLALKHLEYHPPMPPSQQRMKVIEDDRLFWTRVASLNGFDLKEIEPQYTDKDPITPWYEATHPVSGKKLILGTRWRVYSISSKLGGGGNHIPRGEPEKVNEYLSNISK